MKAKRVSQNAPDRSQTPGAEPRTASTSPTRVGSLRAPRRPNPELNGFLVHARARNAAGSPKSIASAAEDEVKEPASPASPQKATPVKTLRQQSKGPAKGRGAGATINNQEGYGPKDAYHVSVASLVLTVCAFCAGLAISIHSSSSAALGYALENGVDAIGSVLVLWRFWGAGTVSEAQLELREKRADVGIAIMFVLLGWLVAINGMATLASHEEADNHSFLLGLPGHLSVSLWFLGFYKPQKPHEVDSMALRKDGFVH